MTAQRTLTGDEPVVTVADGLVGIHVDRGLRMVRIAAKKGLSLNLTAATAKALAMGILMAVRRAEEK